MPSACRRGRISSLSKAYWLATSACTLTWTRSKASSAVMPSGPTSVGVWRCCSFSVEMRISKNSSRLELTMHT
ncbi:Uncharacterised protein [Bordetella pertussis]|nr:Uncharacterised protein [Bordetella pertussis]CPM84304.1 Uncharacterised protein [Bordetella pertussis]